MAVNNVVVLNDVLAGVEVKALDALLRLLKRLADGTIANWHIVIHAEALHKHSNAVALEDTHEVVLTADEELSRTRIALAATATTELVVDAAGIMTSSANNDETTEFGDTLSELNIGTTTSHVCG